MNKVKLLLPLIVVGIMFVGVSTTRSCHNFIETRNKIKDTKVLCENIISEFYQISEDGDILPHKDPLEKFDEWGNRIVLDYTDESMTAQSAGPDGLMGTNDDIKHIGFNVKPIGKKIANWFKELFKK